jgi:hypothetical protein
MIDLVSYLFRAKDSATAAATTSEPRPEVRLGVNDLPTPLTASPTRTRIERFTLLL